MTKLHSPNSVTGTVKLVQDLTKLINSRHGSDVQFKVGGGSDHQNFKSTGETIIDTTAMVTFHAHTAILRCRSSYFEAMFKNEKEWKERSGGVVHMPTTTPTAFQKILDYIYTGDTSVKTEYLPELIAATEEMKIEELGIKCQAMVIHTLEETFSGKEKSKNTAKSKFEALEAQHREQQPLPVTTAVPNLLIPVLKLAYDLRLLDFFQKLFDLTIAHIELILASSEVRKVFINKIPTQIFAQILASDMLAMREYDVWELALDVACHKTMISKLAVESHFKFEGSIDYEMKPKSQKSTAKDDIVTTQPGLLSDEELINLKVALTPLLPAVRFSLMNGEQYSRIVEILNYLLPSRRSVELQRFFAQPGRMRNLDLPRPKSIKERLNQNNEELRIISKIVNKGESWQQMKTWIVESNGITGCHSVNDLRFHLLFRASEYGFLAKAFHEHCDNNGPTLVIVKTSKGHQFGGVNFTHWESNQSYPNTTSNFVFVLVDDHRKIPAKFTYKKKNKLYATHNHPSFGPIFGGIKPDFAIADKANISWSYSNMPQSYHGDGASKTALAGQEKFLLAEYEVFAIFKSG